MIESIIIFPVFPQCPLHVLQSAIVYANKIHDNRDSTGDTEGGVQKQSENENENENEEENANRALFFLHSQTPPSESPREEITNSNNIVKINNG